MHKQTLLASKDSVSILFADVFGYSNLMEQAEQEVCIATIRCISIFVKTSKQYQGRVCEIAGDGLMLQFDSADEAVLFAISMRRQLEKEDTTLSIGGSVSFRIGIHSGPVLVVPEAFEDTQSMWLLESKQKCHRIV